ncbi:MAG: CpXC domain-containing protein [Deltaproteobacteria bacterium]|nr:CpXC domain-containing protein [Deltaproteobacteria bacterium]
MPKPVIPCPKCGSTETALVPASPGLPGKPGLAGRLIARLPGKKGRLAGKYLLTCGKCGHKGVLFVD